MQALSTMQPCNGMMLALGRCSFSMLQCSHLRLYLYLDLFLYACLDRHTPTCTSWSPSSLLASARPLTRPLSLMNSSTLLRPPGGSCMLEAMVRAVLFSGSLLSFRNVSS